MITIFAIFALQYELAIAQGELRYWDRQHDEMYLVTPVGIHQTSEFKKSKDFYLSRRHYLLNRINTIKKMSAIKPKHYLAGSCDVIDFCQQHDIGFQEGNIIKYVTRWKKKNGIEDLFKAKEYLERLILHEEKTLLLSLPPHTFDDTDDMR